MHDVKLWGFLIFSLQSPREQSYSPDEDQLDFEAEDSVSAANASPMFEEPTCVWISMYVLFQITWLKIVSYSKSIYEPLFN